MRRLAHAITIAGALLALGCGSGSSPTAPTGSKTTDLATPPSPAPSASPAVTASTFTFMVDPACRSQFPESVQQRSYTGTSGTYAGVVTLGGDFINSAGFPWNVIYRGSRDAGSSTYVGFNDPPLWERLGSQSYFYIYGYSEYRGTSEYGEWPFWGRVTFCASRKLDAYPACAVPEVTCESAQHRLRVLRN